MVVVNNMKVGQNSDRCPPYSLASPGQDSWPVGMGVPPAKLHEKLRSARGIPRWSRCFFEPVYSIRRGSQVVHNRSLQILLVSTYEMGRQPFGLASPAPSLPAAGHDVTQADVSVTPMP